MIRNYLGFPRGIGGGDLAHRAWEQAVMLGAEFVFMRPAEGIRRQSGRRVMTFEPGDVTADAVIVATGSSYRRLGIPELEELVGAGVYYGAAAGVAPAVSGQDVAVVGGANSAGQAALHLAKFARCVRLVIRGGSLAAGMSDYLVQQIGATPNIDVRLCTRVVTGTGGSRLQDVTIEDVTTSHAERFGLAALFVLIGAEPHTGWLRGTLALDRQGFILTGRDLPASSWSLQRAALPFETVMPGVFAAGDVRSGSVKRVAGAAGEGAVTVGSVHRYLALT